MTKSIAKKRTTGSLPPAVPLAITPTFSAWTHTSDDSYIYQLSLVLATATVSFFPPLCIPCVCIEVWPSHTTNAEPISPLVMSVEASVYAIHPPLPASKTVLSSWSLVVICPLIAPGDTGITAWYVLRSAITGSWYQRYQALYESTAAYVCTIT